MGISRNTFSWNINFKSKCWKYWRKLKKNVLLQCLHCNVNVFCYLLVFSCKLFSIIYQLIVKAFNIVSIFRDDCHTILHRWPQRLQHFLGLSSITVQCISVVTWDFRVLIFQYQNQYSIVILATTNCVLKLIIQ